LGVTDYRIPNSAIQASSSWDTNHGPHRGRLLLCRQGKRIGAWSARHNNRAQWLQVDIGVQAKVTGVATQGRQALKQWVTSYVLAYSRSGIRFTTYRVRRRVKIFRGNKDRNSVVKHPLVPAIRGRYVRFYPKSWFAHISMRVELYGQRTGKENEE
ncbi:predicted protein, partial [Nematostella vectensis]